MTTSTSTSAPGPEASPRTAPVTAAPEDAQARTNARMWARRGLVKKYANRTLRPAEVMLLVRYHEALAGRVLELGCGAGRLTGYLAEIADSVRGIDVSPAMVDLCRETYPGVGVEQGDLRDLSRFPAASLDAVVAPFNVLDVLNDHDRRAVLDEVRRILTPAGLFVMSSHNRAAARLITETMRPSRHDPLRAAITIARLPRWLLNRRRLLPLERNEPGYAILNDVSHDYAGLHYYIARDAQERQLAEHGFDVVECLDREGRIMPAGAEAPDSSEIHYVARPSASSPSTPPR